MNHHYIQRDLELAYSVHFAPEKVHLRARDTDYSDINSVQSTC